MLVHFRGQVKDGLAVEHPDLHSATQAAVASLTFGCDRLHHAVDCANDLLAPHGRRRLIWEPELIHEIDCATRRVARTPEFLASPPAEAE